MTVEVPQHLVLARKYRPQKFSEVIEQPTAVRALQNALEQSRLGAAYLFYGPRGVGKTSIARILAKRVNCESPEGNEPCDRCESCLSILEGNSMDVMEIDAASHRGIHHIRELRENVQFQPMNSKKKVYIIDEVHMLTTESFNALLKTLEEPPAHVLFILATTEYNKIPETILSRCQVFTFRKLSLQIAQSYMQELCKREGVEIEPEALFWIARRGDGSVRDNLSFLEQAIAYSDGVVTTAKVKELIGATRFEHYSEITRCLLDEQCDRTALLQPLYDLFHAGADLSRFIWEYLDYLRLALHIRSGLKDAEFLGIPSRDIEEIESKHTDVDPVRLQQIFQSIYSLLQKSFALRLRNSYETRVLIEVELMTLREELHQPSLSGVMQKLNRFAAALQGEAESESEAPPTPSAQPNYEAEKQLKEQFLGIDVDPESLP